MYYLLIPFVANYFIHFTGIIHRIQILLVNLKLFKLPPRLKPFDCEHCLAFWLTVFYISSTHDWRAVILLSSFNAITSAYLSYLITKTKW